MPTKKKKPTLAQLRKRKLAQEFRIVIVRPKMSFIDFAEHVWEIGEDCALIHGVGPVWMIDIHHESKSMRDSLLFAIGYLKKKNVEIREIRMYPWD